MKKRFKYIAISFLVPIFILLLVYMIWGQYPFGENTLLVWDMDEQYAPFFAHLHNILHGDASVLYTFSRSLGGNMLSVAAYYLISPFNLVFYFFNAENIYIGILLVAILKTGASGASMYWFLSRKKQDLSAIIFSTAYALSAYMAAYQFNIFWIDAMILLPFVCEGIERLVDGQKYLLYALAIALSVITNFYTGYMICIFSVMYFICYFFFISDKKYRFKTLITYIVASFLGGMLSMCVSLPALEIMQGGKVGISLDILKNFKNMFKYGEFFDSAFCAMISDKQITSGRPLIYCGVFALIMTLYWLLGREVSRKKLGYLLVLFAITISFHHYNLNCVWHAFNPPVGSPHRFSFIYVFIFLYMAYMGYINLIDAGDSAKIGIIGVGLCLGLLCRLGAFMERQKIGILVLNIFLVGVYIALILLIKNKKTKSVLVLIFTCAELFINAEFLYTVSKQYASISVTEYQAYMQEMLPLVEAVKDAEILNDGIVRTAIDRSAMRVDNDPFLLNIYSLSSYTSLEKQNVMQIASDFGYSHHIRWGMHYNNGTTNAGDSFLGIKYIITGEDPGLGYDSMKESTAPSATDEISIYENENVLPFAIIADESILDIHSSEDTFQYMNELYYNLDTENNEDIFVKLEGELLQETSSFLEYKYETDMETIVYTRYDRAGVSNAEVYIADKMIDLSSQRSDVKNIGLLPAGTEFKVRFYLPENGIPSPDKIYIYGERENILKDYAMEVNAQPVNISMNNEAHIKISCTNGNDEPKYLICTIPYDKGWNAKVDGKKTEVLDVQNFVALPIDSGTHEIELKFIPSGLYVGIVMTLVSAFALIIMLYGRKTKHFIAESSG